MLTACLIGWFVFPLRVLLFSPPICCCLYLNSDGDKHWKSKTLHQGTKVYFWFTLFFDIFATETWKTTKGEKNTATREGQISNRNDTIDWLDLTRGRSVWDTRQVQYDMCLPTANKVGSGKTRVQKKKNGTGKKLGISTQQRVSHTPQWMCFSEKPSVVRLTPDERVVRQIKLTNCEPDTRKYSLGYQSSLAYDSAPVSPYPCLFACSFQYDLGHVKILCTYFIVVCTELRAKCDSGERLWGMK